ncbi:MAG: hypothetical protein AAF492_06650, partial [Verrucomicrobiota bacterium]
MKTIVLFWAVMGLGPVQGEADVSLSERDIHRLIKQLASEDWILQAESFELLGRNKIAKAVPAIRERLQQGTTSWARGRALVALSRISGADMFATAEEMS